MRNQIREYFIKAKDSDLIALSFSGVISAFGFSPFNLFFLSLIGFAVYFVKFENAVSIKQALKGTFAFAFCFHLASLYWFACPLLVSPEKHAIFIPFALTLAPAYLSLFWLIPAFIVKKYSRGLWQDVFVLSALLALTMYFYGHYLPGFPWVYVGYIWLCCDSMAQSLSLVGIHGLNLITLLMSGVLGAGAVVFKKSNNKMTLCITWSLVVDLMALMFAFGYCRLLYNPTEYTSYTARIVQGNLSQREKMDKHEVFTNLQKHIALSEHSSFIDFIIWPEASIPYLYRENSWKLNRLLQSPLSYGETLIAGAVREDITTHKIFNSIIIVDCFGRNTECYDKIRLVPFGEYIPLRKYLPWQGLAVDIGDFDRGDKSRIIEVNGLKMIFAICYEAVFPQDFIPKEGRADVIINVTNDAWFGCTIEPFQHLQIVRARAIESGLPLIRVTNFGISAVFDALGRELGRVPICEHGVFDFFVPKNVPITPYGKFGDNIFFVLVLMSLGLAFMMKNGKE
ncbi:MAG: apolipoprotein N-acyltransferase [Alphaproteobacteria bacterium]|nr:apolipoprotein N-acyltransferase [Alphaproteobacteria bacterium]